MGKMNVAYLRVSTEAQTEKYGLDMQKQKIMDFCSKNGIEIERWYIDGGCSGSRLERPEIQKLLEDAEAGQIGTVYIYKLDRMSRDVIDTLTLLYRVLPQYGVETVSMTEELRFENPMDKVMIGVNAIMGQYEREVMRMRMTAGMKERVRKGLWRGGGRTPFGYRYDRNDGILHPVPEQAEILKRVYDAYISGQSFRAIARIFGFRHDAIVAQMLRTQAYIGMIEYNGEVYQGLHEPIIDKETFYKAQERMKRQSTNSRVSSFHVLTGLCWCGVCGARMRYHGWGSYHKLVCYSQYESSRESMKRDPNCSNKKAIAREIESYVERAFKKFIVSAKESARESNVDFLEGEIKKANSKIKKLYSFYLDNESDNILELIREEEKRAAELKKQLGVERENENRRSYGKISEIRRVADAWDDLSDQDKNKLLKECVDKVIISGDDIEIRFIIF